MARCLRDNKEYNGEEIVIERPDGSRLTVLAHANPFHDDDGNLLGAVNVLMDITDRKRAEDVLRDSDRRKSEFLATLSHELRNPLAPLRNGLQIIRLSGDDPTAADQARVMMERQLAQMVRLIDDLLDLSRIANGKIELRRGRMDLANAVKDAVEMSRPLIEERAQELVVTLPPKSVFVDGDRTRLAQVFANLLNNSAKYTEPGGRVWLTVEQQGSDVIVSVKDNGVGIAKEKLEVIFEMFTQVDRALGSDGGLGIGLNLVRGLLQMHGGRVEAYSDGPGQGSEFVVRLPVLLTSPRTPEDPTVPDDNEHPGCAYRILVVDDNKDLADSLAIILRINGHDARTANDGLAAIELASVFQPQVVLLDIGLPKLNGYEVARRIRTQPWGQNMVLIAQTGWGQEDDKRKSKEAGFNFHLVKPVDPSALEKLLAGLLLTPA